MTPSNPSDSGQSAAHDANADRTMKKEQDDTKSSQIDLSDKDEEDAKPSSSPSPLEPTSMTAQLADTQVPLTEANLTVHTIQTHESMPPKPPPWMSSSTEASVTSGASRKAMSERAPSFPSTTVTAQPAAIRASLTIANLAVHTAQTPGYKAPPLPSTVASVMPDALEKAMCEEVQRLVRELSAHSINVVYNKDARPPGIQQIVDRVLGPRRDMKGKANDAEKSDSQSRYIMKLLEHEHACRYYMNGDDLKRLYSTSLFYGDHCDREEDEIHPNVQRTDDAQWKTSAENVHNGPKLPLPTPGITFGYPKSSFTQDQHSELTRRYADALVLSDTCLPYHVVEWEGADSNYKRAGEVEALLGAATAVKANHLLYTKLGISTSPEDTAMFATVVESEFVTTYVCWREETESALVFRMSPIKELQLSLEREADAYDARSIHINIREWATETRLPLIKGALDASFKIHTEEAAKKTAEETAKESKKRCREESAEEETEVTEKKAKKDDVEEPTPPTSDSG
ncbi:uncharacterized protein K452DRAFT_298910 [Aplosporella prunicola CBS 121167]|uniref:DUF7924 domain-containing protein n=1 Tax=Aplosporella prunicola CBS 121167 TaxID=1176127 RepID=A0A6A6B9W5_9PEZI|nr:uncharacterized protein K452DRAFT_298910 [Aplosporella prunicola CBS 121167]KAF2140826.1 hypothetical protein K452DRAFT_298910 [Aplosporella prunicola CBS 121167]